MTTNSQHTKEQLVEQALADPRIADAIRAYDAARPFVPEQSFATVVTTYSASTQVTSSGSSA